MEGNASGCEIVRRSQTVSNLDRSRTIELCRPAERALVHPRRSDTSVPAQSRPPPPPKRPTSPPPRSALDSTAPVPEPAAPSRTAHAVTCEKTLCTLITEGPDDSRARSEIRRCTSAWATGRSPARHHVRVDRHTAPMWTSAGNPAYQSRRHAHSPTAIRPASGAMQEPDRRRCGRCHRSSSQASTSDAQPWSAIGRAC
jgi:hypothetical protein